MRQRINLLTSMIASVALFFLAAGGCANCPVTQRTGRVTMGSRPITVLGNPVQPGETAPAFKAVANDMTVYHFQPGHGIVWILSSVPSLDTPVCSLETRHFNEVASTLGPDVGVITISLGK